MLHEVSHKSGVIGLHTSYGAVIPTCPPRRGGGSVMDRGSRVLSSVDAIKTAIDFGEGLERNEQAGL
jgi:hypothetical protein